MVIAAFLFGTTFVVVKEAVADIAPIAFVGWRFLIGAAALLVLSFPTKARLWRDGLIAGGWLFAGYAFQTAGLRHTSAGNSALVTGLYVVLTPLMVAAWNRARPSPWVVTGTVVGFIGLSLLTLDDQFRLGSGDLLTLACALGFAGHITFLSRVASRHPVVPFTAVQLGVTAVAGLAYSAAFEGIPVPAGSQWWPIIATGLAVSAAAYLLQVWAQTRVGPARTAVLLTLEPVFALAVAAVVAGERLDARGWLGAILILGAVQLVLAKEPRSPAVEAEAISPAH